jgi:HlyD family secretion protein
MIPFAIPPAIPSETSAATASAIAPPRLAVQLVTGVVTCTVLVVTACTTPPPSNVLRASGHVEATEVRLSAEVGGRILELRAGEGDRVSAGDTIARLDTREVELQAQRARADRQAADAQLRLLLAGSRREDVRQAEAHIAVAEADVSGVDVELTAAVLDFDRFESLVQANAGSQKQRDDARARADAARERQRSARERVRVSREALSRLQAGARPEEIDGARARVAAIDAQLATLGKHVADATVLSPVAGVVTQKLADVGEIVAPGTPLLVVTDLDHAWANVFVPEPSVPRITLGQTATIRTDAGGEGLPGRVTFVSPRAEFTPRNVQTADERSKLVYRIKVAVDNTAGVLKTGMPVDAELALR